MMQARQTITRAKALGPMRIAIISWTRRRAGGVESYLDGIIPSLVHAGHDVALWHEVDVPTDRDPIRLPQGVPAVCAADVGQAAAIAELRAWQPDLIYAHGLDDPDLEGQVLEVAPSVFFVHAYYGMCISGSKTFKRAVVTPCSRVFGWPCLVHYFPHGCGGRSPLTMWREYQRQSARLTLLRRYDAVVTHTDHMRAELARHGLAARQVLFPVCAAGPVERDVSSQGWRLLFAGRMDFLKGGHVFLDALPRVRAVLDRPVSVTFAGDGPERVRWERQAARLTSRTEGLLVQFVGWASQPQLESLMAETDLLVVPSLWPEPFGAIGPIAGSRGVPAAAFAVGGIPQWLVDGVSGHLAPGDPPTASGLAEAILKCLADPLEYARLRSGAVQIAGRFGMNTHLGLLLEVFQEVVAGTHVRMPRELRR